MTGTVLGPYQLERQLGEGGMGEVWLATEVRLGRKVAVKLLPGDLTHDPSRVARFEQEARAASALSHPNVCTIHALGETPDGQHYIAMEHVEGTTLRRRLAEDPPALRGSLDIAVQVASALAAAHAAGIVHRDIKPENVIVRPDGLVKVLDFGLAKLVAASDVVEQHATKTSFRTTEGAVVGTIAYMSPEQARGQTVDARTDVWALGCMLYEMAARQSPFAGASSSDVLAAILDREPPPLTQLAANVPPELQRIVKKALRKDREQRYQTVKDLRLDLEALRQELAAPEGESAAAARLQQPAAAPVSGSGERAATMRRRRALAIAVGMVLLVAAAAGAWLILGRPRSPTSPVTRNLTRLTFGSGLQTDVTWSPDGTRIAYAADTAGNFDIWVQPVDGGDAVALTTSPAQDTQPAWSPDGRTIVFRSERDGGGLYLVPALGGPERQLTSFGAYPQWTPDGSEVLFRGGAIAVWQTNLNVVAAGGGHPPRELLREFLTGGGWTWIGSHPDGRVSATGVHAQSGYGFFTLSRDGQHVTKSELPPELPLQIAEGSASGQGTRVERFRWNHDGTALYVEANVNEVGNIWRVAVEPRTLRWMSAERLTAGMGADVGAAVSPDGTRVAFTTERRVSRLWVFPFDPAAGRVTGEGRPVTPEEGLVEASDLSPDGRRVAYLLRRAGTTRKDLWTVDVESGRHDVLAQGVVAARWSRDSRSIAYSLFRLDAGEWALAVRALSGPERLLSPWSSESALLPCDWTRDGASIMGTYHAPIAADSRLALWPATTPSQKPARIVMAERGMNLWQPRYSPDGRWLAFVVTRAGSGEAAELMVSPAVGAPASRWVRLATDHAWADKPRWAPDGRTLYFLSRHGGAFFNLWGVRFDPARGLADGEPFQITRLDSPGLMISPDIGSTDAGISPGRALLTMASVTGNIWMLDNADR